MNDRELLEMAAKAAGIETRSDEHGLMTIAQGPFQIAWDPRQEDGQALRLAVKLKLRIDHSEHAVHVGLSEEDEYIASESVSSAIPRDKAMRRAIFRAAAEIGRKMQEGGAA